MIFRNVIEAMGNTPLVEITRLHQSPGVKILAKVECVNPGGSIKDRVALAMIERAERLGELTPETRDKRIIIEATSGNTGIGLAMVCAVKGYRLRLIMSERASEERKQIVQAYGAEIQLTPGHLSTDGAIEEAYRLAREEPETYVLMDQFNNPASIDAHYNGTGKEIWEQTKGAVTHAVLTLGTSGTAMGVTKRLKECDPNVRVVAVEPFAGHSIQGLKNMQESYPPGIYDKHALDRIMHVEDDEAFDMARKLAREEGILAGMSSGAAMAAAVKLAKELDSEGKEGLIVVILPDSGERYLSTPLFAPKRRQGVKLHSVEATEPKYLEPGKEGVGLFTMGPPLDALDSLDAWRRIAILDVLARHLRRSGTRARLVVGMADMDDRSITAMRAQNMGKEAFWERTIAELRHRATFWGLGDEVSFHGAGENVDTIIDLCRKMLLKGAAYEKLRSVYFDVLRFPSYGQLAPQDLESLSLGKTVDLADYVKDNPKDFTLLKRASLRDLKSMDCLQTEWGNVRPSWFLQHAAVALDHLPRVDVCMAGENQRFPHLENLRALWAMARSGTTQSWLICRGVAAETDTPKFPPQAVEMDRHALRMWLLSTAPGKPLNLSVESLGMWRSNWSKVQSLTAALNEQLFESTRNGEKASLSSEVEQCLVDLRTGYKQALEDNLELHRYWAALSQFCREIRRMRQKDALRGGDASACLKQLKSHDQVLGFLDTWHMPLPRAKWPREVALLAAQREEARSGKDYARADSLRDEILQAGYRLEDTARGVRLFKK